MNKLLLFMMVSVGIVTVAGQAASADTFHVFDGKGNPTTIDEILRAMDTAEVVFLGEQHDDTVAHKLQLEIFQKAAERYAADRRIALSMEMFERDVQIVVNEYLAGQISESQFLASSRPWGNYATDYKPLVEFAKQRRLPVIAANAPRRYVNMVSRNGRDSLMALTKDAKEWLPSLPYGEPTEQYAKKFRALMGSSPEAQMGVDKILASQTLWDAAMGDAVARYLKDHKKGLIIHLNGSFHTEGRLGTVDQLLRYRPKTKVLVVTMKYVEDFHHFDTARDAGAGDFVILTDTKQPRSKR
jgi:uncharacterized iron-regulated protein